MWKEEVWPGITGVLPFVWGKCAGNDKPEMNLKNLTGFEFPDTLPTDMCVGVVGAEHKLTYPKVASLFGLPETIKTPNFLKVGLNYIHATCMYIVYPLSTPCLPVAPR